MADGSDLDFHALRTTYINMLFRSKLTLQQVKVLARHSDITTTMKYYNRLGLDDVADAFYEVMDDRFQHDSPEILDRKGVGS